MQFVTRVIGDSKFSYQLSWSPIIHTSGYRKFYIYLSYYNIPIIVTHSSNQSVEGAQQQLRLTSDARVLCSVDDEHAALMEIYRVLKPGRGAALWDINKQGFGI